jgi:hypothetical protein
LEISEPVSREFAESDLDLTLAEAGMGQRGTIRAVVA